MTCYEIVRLVWMTIAATASVTIVVQFLVSRLARARAREEFRAARTADAFGALARGIQEAWGWRADAMADVEGAADKLRDALVDYGTARATMMAFGSPEVVRILVAGQRGHEFDAAADPAAVGESMTELARQIRHDVGAPSLTVAGRDVAEYLIPTGRWTVRSLR